MECVSPNFQLLVEDRGRAVVKEIKEKKKRVVVERWLGAKSVRTLNSQHLHSKGWHLLLLSMCAHTHIHTTQTPKRKRERALKNKISKTKRATPFHILSMLQVAVPLMLRKPCLLAKT